MNIFYIYILFRLNGIPCYVGKGHGERCFSHFKRTSHNPYLARIIAKAGGILPVVIVRENLSEADAFAAEIVFIKAIGRGKNGPLVNLTDGGDGFLTGHKQTPEQLAKLSAARKGKTLSQASRELIRQKLKGIKKTPEHCAAVSAAKKGKSPGPMSEEHKAAIGRAHMGQRRSPEAIAAMVLANANRSEEAKLLKSARISAALTGKKLSDEHRANIGAVQKGRKRSEEAKEHVRIGALAYHAARRLAAAMA